eukprot:EG_transcript_6608
MPTMISTIRWMCGGTDPTKSLQDILGDTVREYTALMELLDDSSLPLDRFQVAIKLCNSLIDQVMQMTQKEKDHTVRQFLAIIQLQSNVLERVICRHLQFIQPTLVIAGSLASGVPLRVGTLRPVVRVDVFRAPDTLGPLRESRVEAVARLQQMVPGLSAERAREVLRQTDHDPNAAGLLLLSEAETHQPPIGPSPSGSPDGCLHTVPLGRCCGSIGSTLGSSRSSSCCSAGASDTLTSDPGSGRTSTALSAASLSVPPPIQEPPVAATPLSPPSSPEASRADTEVDSFAAAVPQRPKNWDSVSKAGASPVCASAQKEKKWCGAKRKPAKVISSPDFPSSPSEVLLQAQARMVRMLASADCSDGAGGAAGRPLESRNAVSHHPPCPAPEPDGAAEPRAPPDPAFQDDARREADIALGKERLARRLRSLQLEEVVMADDGHCQFRALAHQLCGSADHHAWVRQQVVERLTHHKEEYVGFIAEDGETKYAQYVEGQAKGAWGDEITLRAFADAFGVAVHVVMSMDGPWCQMWGSSEATRHVVLSYLHPVHYNSVLPMECHLPPTPSLNLSSK